MRFEDQLLHADRPVDQDAAKTWIDRQIRRAAFFSILRRIALVVGGAMGIAALYGVIITKVAA